MQLKTINVIEMDDTHLPTSLTAFPDTEEGRQEAEGLFRQLVAETTDLEGDEIEEALEDGYAEVPGGGDILLVRSTEP